MRTARGLRLVVPLVVLLGASLASCSGDADPPLTPGPLPSSTPVYASEEEALAAAEEAYGRYLEVSNAVGAAGWVDTEPLGEVLRGDALEDELNTVAEYIERDLTQLGEVTFDSIALQQFSADSLGEVVVSVYLCLDVSGVDLVDDEGQSVISEDRPDRQPVEVDLDDVDGALKVSRSDAWSGTSFC